VDSQAQGVGEGVDEGGLDAGAAGEQLVGAHREHRAHLAGRERRAGSTRVAAQQAQAVRGLVVLADRHRALRADAGAPAVQPPAGGEPLRGPPGAFGPFAGLGGHRGHGFTVGERDQLADGESGSLQDDPGTRQARGYPNRSVRGRGFRRGLGCGDVQRISGSLVHSLIR
jgi:hypothetical protein